MYLHSFREKGKVVLLGDLPSFSSSLLSHEYTEQEGLWFLVLLLLFSSVTLSINFTNAEINRQSNSRSTFDDITLCHAHK